MKKLEDNTILVGENSLNYDELIAKLADLSIKNITDILLESQITLPRKFNVTALRLALNEKIVIAKTLNLSDEELFRLRFYPFFNEFQLQKLFNTLQDDNIYTNYRRYLIELMIQNSEYLRLEDNLVNKLLNIPNKFEDFNTYQTCLNQNLYDFDGYFDGVKFEDYDENILKSLTSDDIRTLGSKYGINIPKRLKKEELVAYVKEVMHEGGLLIPENVNLDSQSIMMVQRFAKKNNIKISADLKKDECLNYLFHQINKEEKENKKEVLLNLYLGDSFVFDLAYVTKVEEKVEPEVTEVVSTPVVEEVKEEAPIIVVEEEKKEEPKEEPKVEQPKVVTESASQIVVTQPIIDPKELVNVITASVKEIVVDVVKEIVPLFTKQETVKEEPKTEEEIIEQNVYNYNNFSNQQNPNFDPEIHGYIKNYDCKAINPNYEEIKVESEKFVIEDLAEDNIVPEVVEEVDDDSNLTEEERILRKKERKAQKKQAKIEAKRLSKEEKEKAKAMTQEEKAALKQEKKEQKAQAKLEKKALKAESKAQAIEEKKQEKLRLAEEKKENKERAKEEKRNNKIRLKEEKIQAKKDAKEKYKEEKRAAKQKIKDDKQAVKDAIAKEIENDALLQKVFKNKGYLSLVDSEYLDKYIKLNTYKLLVDQKVEKEKEKRKQTSSRIFKVFFGLVFLAGLTYVALAVTCVFLPETNPLYVALTTKPVLKDMFEGFIRILKNLFNGWGLGK